MPGHASDMFDFVKRSMDRHLDRVKAMVLDGKAGRYTPARLVSDSVACSLDVLDFWRTYPLPWDDEVPLVEIKVKAGEDIGWGAQPISGLPEGELAALEPKRGAWPSRFDATIEARVVGSGPSSLVVRVSGARAAGVASGTTLGGLLKADKVHAANFEVKFE